MSKQEAIKAGLKEAVVQLAENVPGLSSLIEGIRTYQEDIQEQQRQEFILTLDKKVSEVENVLNKEWYKTSDGKEIANKIFSSALNSEYNDKIDYFANAFINSAQEFNQFQRLKFIEVLKIVSKPALIVLSKEYELQNQRTINDTGEVNLPALIKNLDMDPHLIESCVKELYNIGVFSSVIEYSESGNKKSYFQSGTSAYTEFTERFIEFIRDPRIN